MSVFNAIAPLAPGCQGTLYDTALRGMHHQELMRNLGWLSINRVTAKQVATNNGKAVKRVEKATHIKTESSAAEPCGSSHRAEPCALQSLITMGSKCSPSARASKR
jgi:hypothetical protein